MYVSNTLFQVPVLFIKDTCGFVRKFPLKLNRNQYCEREETLKIKF